MNVFCKHDKKILDFCLECYKEEVRNPVRRRALRKLGFKTIPSDQKRAEEYADSLKGDVIL